MSSVDKLFNSWHGTFNFFLFQKSICNLKVPFTKDHQATILGPSSHWHNLPSGAQKKVTLTLPPAQQEEKALLIPNLEISIVTQVSGPKTLAQDKFPYVLALIGSFLKWLQTLFFFGWTGIMDFCLVTAERLIFCDLTIKWCLCFWNRCCNILSLVFSS